MTILGYRSFPRVSRESQKTRESTREDRPLCSASGKSQAFHLCLFLLTNLQAKTKTPGRIHGFPLLQSSIESSLGLTSSTNEENEMRGRNTDTEEYIHRCAHGPLRIGASGDVHNKGGITHMVHDVKNSQYGNEGSDRLHNQTNIRKEVGNICGKVN